MEELKIVEQVWKEAEAKLMQLRGECTEVQRRIDNIDGQVAAMRDKPRVDPVTSAAQKLLAGEYTGPADVNPLFTERDDLIVRRRVIKEAIRLQENIAQEACSNYAILAGKATRPEHKAVVRNMVKAAITMARAVEKEEAFRMEFHRLHGVSFTKALGSPVNFMQFGTLGDRFSQVNIFLEEAIRRGFVTKEEVEEMKRIA